MYEDGFTDIHCHILPGVDDGSGSMGQTLQMITLAKQQGIKTIIATPHYACGAKNKLAARLLKILEEVQKETLKLGGEFRIYPGNELYYSEGIMEALKTGEAFTLAGSRYVLVEFSLVETYQTLYRGMGQLVMAGYIPILAHVERYLCLRGKESRIVDMIKLGTCMQMNSGSLLGGMFNREAVYHRRLVKEGLVHFIASDCHNTGSRPPRMKDAYKALVKNNDCRLVDRIFLENPRKILENKYI